MRMYFGLESQGREVNANGSSPRLRVNENRYFPDPRLPGAEQVRALNSTSQRCGFVDLPYIST